VFLVHQEEKKRLMVKTLIGEKITWNNIEQKTCAKAIIPIKEKTLLILSSYYWVYRPS